MRPVSLQAAACHPWNGGIEYREFAMFALFIRPIIARRGIIRHRRRQWESNPQVPRGEPRLFRPPGSPIPGASAVLYSFRLLFALALAVVPVLAAIGSGPSYPEPREIIGGRLVDPYAEPFNSAVYISSTLRCTGALIRREWVLTAAHCVEGATRAGTTVEFGWVEDGDRSRFEAQVGVRRIILHPQYENVAGDEAYTHHDMALIHLRQPFRHAIARTYQNVHGVPRPIDGSPVVAAGYGRMDGDRPSPGLMGADWTVAECPPELMNGRILSEFMLCVAGTEASRVAVGDSGGPLYFRPHDAYEVAGVLSWLDYVDGEDGERTYYSIYSSAFAYRNWIGSHLFAPEGSGVRVEITNELSTGCAVSVFTYNGESTYERGEVESEFSTAFALTSDLDVEAIIHLRCNQGE